MMLRHRFVRFLAILLVSLSGLMAVPALAALTDISDIPLFIGGNGNPLTMLVMGRDHKLYYEAYNDASDLNGDGVVDVGYKPNLEEWNIVTGACKKDANNNCIPLDYYGYFDSHKCYTYTNSRFEPISTTTNKKCSGSWSGDFLNYLTTSRMDALRRVLYGGLRSTDTSSLTVLERSYIPQDAHSWGKEYESETRDGYLISDYTPLAQPDTNKRHLFANTTLLCPSGNSDPGCNANQGLPLLRVLTNTSYRVWEWLSIERPVAGVQCAVGNNSRANCAGGGSTNYDSYPNNHDEYESLVTIYATDAHKQGSQNVATIDGSGNPFGNGDYYLTIFKGTIKARTSTGGEYKFAVDGDDAVEVIIDGTVVAGWYGGHGECNCHDHYGSINFTAGSTHTIEFRHQESTGNDSYHLWWQPPGLSWEKVPQSSGGRGFTSLTQTVYDVKISSGAAMTDYVVRVKACEEGSGFTRETECQGYPNNAPTVYKPTGLLQEYGEPDRMAFGLLTGSYTNNLSGGVLRKNISSLTDEIDATNGIFKTTITGVIRTIDKLKIYGFGSGVDGDYYHFLDCRVPEVKAMQQGRCRMWGNPIAEMMYEGLRYFAGNTAGTSAFTTGVTSSGTGTDDAVLGLPLPTWQDPYRTTSGGYPKCSKPFELVISDINPSFDTDQLPGSYFLSDANNPKDISGNSLATLNDTLSELNVTDRANTIWNGEKANEGTKVFIGQSKTVYDGAPTPKTIDNFSNIRGLTPEEPTRQGGFYAASVAFYGHTRTDGFGPGKQKVDTFSVALASPLPRIEIPITVGGTTKKITLVPFGKSVSGSGIDSAINKFQPTNTIVDFYVDTLKNTGTANHDDSVNSGRAYGKFRINFEDSEYGSDHDMDAIVTYEFTVNADNTLTVKLDSNYAAGGVVQHMGYVISGTSHDGVYLEVRDSDTTSGDPDYFLDTPPGCYAYDPSSSDTKSTLACRQDGVLLPLSNARTFTADISSAVFIKHDPLWYAAKWGGFIEDDNNPGQKGEPDKTSEWDTDGNGIPDNYFLVTNASKLKEQLTEAFEKIGAQSSSAAAVAINSGVFNPGSSRVYQAKFHSGDWSGHLKAYDLNANGTPIIPKVWDAADKLNLQNFDTDRKILTYRVATGATGDTVNKGIPFRWPSNLASLGTSDLNLTQVNALKGSDAASVGQARLEFLRGNPANEGDKGLKLFRTRIETEDKDVGEGAATTRIPFVLGDLINSNPTYIAAPQMRFDALLKGTGTTNEAAAYSDFRIANSSRTAMVYVGSNDGMLHGFAAADGTETIAYVPNLVFANLAKLTEPGYGSQHRFFVDGSPRIGDVYWDNLVGDTTYDRNDWHTILVGSLRKGGTGLFALDITDPTSFTESNAASLVLWEFTNADLGYTFSQPSLVRLNNGTWAAVFGNGYNNTGNGHAILFLIDAKTGGNTAASGFLKELDTGVGSTTTPNGLSTPLMIDINADGIADYAYAGDLSGNLWRFNLTSNDPNLWTFNLLFAAKDDSSPTPKAQPITAKPVAVRHPNGGLVILFGTGRYLGATDVTTTDKQTFYGIWDPDPSATPPTITRATLQQQTIDTVTALISGQTFRTSSATNVCWVGDTCGTPTPVAGTMRGWYVDLPGITQRPAERVTSDPLLVGQNVVFTSLAPSSDPCDFGGTSWLNVLDATTGKRASESFVSLSGGTNGQPITATPITATVNGESVAPTSLQQDVITSAPTKMDAPYAVNIYTTDSEGKVRVTHLSSAGLTGRLSWRQLELEQ